MEWHGISKRYAGSWRGLLLACPLLALATAGLAGEPLLGRVLSVDEKKGEMVLSLDASVDNSPRQLTLPLAKDRRTVVGDLVRVWPGGEGKGIAGTMRTSPVHASGSRADPTGVRSRLMRLRGPDRGRQSGGRRGR